MSGEAETSNTEIISNFVPCNRACTISDLKMFSKINERTGARRPEESVVPTATSVGLTVFRTDPEVSGAAVHEDLEILRWGADLDDGEITDISSTVKVENENGEKCMLNLGLTRYQGRGSC